MALAFDLLTSLIRKSFPSRILIPAWSKRVNEWRTFLALPAAGVSISHFHHIHDTYTANTVLSNPGESEISDSGKPNTREEHTYDFRYRGKNRRTTKHPCKCTTPVLFVSRLQALPHILFKSYQQECWHDFHFGPYTLIFFLFSLLTKQNDAATTTSRV